MNISYTSHVASIDGRTMRGIMLSDLLTILTYIEARWAVCASQPNAGDRPHVYITQRLLPIISALTAPALEVDPSTHRAMCHAFQVGRRTSRFWRSVAP